MKNVLLILVLSGMGFLKSYAQSTDTLLPLAVQAQLPPYLSEGDRLEILVHISNNTKAEVTGQVQLLLFDAITNESVDGWFQNVFPNQYFTAAPGSPAVIPFPVEVPYLFGRAVRWQVVASSGKLTHSQQQLLTIHTQRTLITQTTAAALRPNETQTFHFPQPLSNNNEQNNLLMIEGAADPSFFAMEAAHQAMQHQSAPALQTFHYFFANALCAKMKTTPLGRQIINADTATANTNLQHAHLLATLSSAPEQIHSLSQMLQQADKALDSSMGILKSWGSSKGFSFFTGGPPHVALTQYIVAGLGRLIKLGALTQAQQLTLQPLIKDALSYLDENIAAEYKRMVVAKKVSFISPLQVNYLYARSFFTDIPIAQNNSNAYKHLYRLAQQSASTQSVPVQAMIAAMLVASNEKEKAKTVTKNIIGKWKKDSTLLYKTNNNNNTTWWWHTPQETAALMIDAIAQSDQHGTTLINSIKKSMLSNNSTLQGTSAAAAAYALFKPDTAIDAHNITAQLQWSRTTGNLKAAPYFKKIATGPLLQQNNTIVVKAQSGATDANPLWCRATMQYFTEAPPAKTNQLPVQASRQLWVFKKDAKKFTPLPGNEPIMQGDTVQVRISLKVASNSLYLQLTDVGAAGLQPALQESILKKEGALTYYQSTAAVNTFYFTTLPKGTYTLTYKAVATHKGSFSFAPLLLQQMFTGQLTQYNNNQRINIE